MKKIILPVFLLFFLAIPLRSSADSGQGTSASGVLTSRPAIYGTVKVNHHNLPIPNAPLILNAPNLTCFTATTDYSGLYYFLDPGFGTHFLSVAPQGFIQGHRNFSFTSYISRQDFSLDSNLSGQIDINPYLTLYYQGIEEIQSNVYRTVGPSNINHILQFPGEIILDMRPPALPAISGNLGYYASGIAGQDVLIYEGGSPYTYRADENNLLPGALSYLVQLTGTIQGFNSLISNLEIDSLGKYVRVSYIPEFPEPIGRVIDSVKKSAGFEKLKKYFNIRKVLAHTGISYDGEIKDLGWDFGVFQIKDLSVSIDAIEHVYEGGLTVRVPGEKLNLTGKPKGQDTVLSDIMNSPVVLLDQGGGYLSQTSFGAILGDSKALGLKYLEFGLSIAFKNGTIDSFAINFSTEIPLWSSGLKITKIKGGIRDWTGNNWRFFAMVDLETAKVPLLKFEDMGVEIKIPTYWSCRGKVKVADFDMIDGVGFYDHEAKKPGLNFEGNLKILDYVKGTVRLFIRYDDIEGDADLELTVPDFVNRLRRYLAGKGMGVSDYKFRNGAFYSTVLYEGKSFASKIQLIPMYPYFQLYIGSDYDDMVKIWKGTKDSLQTIAFEVPPNLSRMMIVTEDTLSNGEAGFSLVNPAGVVFDSTNTDYSYDPVSNQSVMVLDRPMAGEWDFRAEDLTGLLLGVQGKNQAPSILTGSPGQKKALSQEISLTLNDYADTVSVMIFYDNDNTGFDGVLIDSFRVVNNAALTFEWQTAEIPDGEYYIYSMADDGKNSPVFQYAPGSVLVQNTLELETPQNFTVTRLGDSLLAQWSPPLDPRVQFATVFYKKVSETYSRQRASADCNYLFINELEYGDKYRFYCRFADTSLVYGPASDTVEIVFTSAPGTNSPYFTTDPGSSFVFIEGEPASYTLSAADADGDALTFAVPGDTLGLAINGNILSWIPPAGSRGASNQLLTVTDGLHTDSLYRQVLVFSQEQVAVHVEFSSVNLYEEDNMYLKIRNYKCPDPTRPVLLTNLRTGDTATVTCRRADDFEFIGTFGLSYKKSVDLPVANGDTIRADYTWNGQIFSTTALYDSLRQPSDVTAPGQISDLAVLPGGGNLALLRWTATGNDGSLGKAYRYDIRYSYSPIGDEASYFTAYRLAQVPYPSPSGSPDSLSVDLGLLDGVQGHDTVYFAVKAEDEMQNRSMLSNLAVIGFSLMPADLDAVLSPLYKVSLTWTGPEEGSPGFLNYRLYRRTEGAAWQLLSDTLATSAFTDDLFSLPDGTYRYALQAVYLHGTSDTLYSGALQMDRFTDLTLLVELENAADYTGALLQLTGLDTVYAQSYSIATNPTGLVFLTNVYKSQYSVHAERTGYCGITDTLEVDGSAGSQVYTLGQVPQVFTLTGPPAYCAGSMAALQLSGSQTGIVYQLVRNGNPDGLPVPGTGLAVQLFGSGPGTYSVLARSSLVGCSAAMDGTVTLEEVQGPQASAGTDTTVVFEGSLALNASVFGGAAPYTYSWSPDSLLNNPAIPGPVTQSLTQSAVFTLVVTDQNGCTDTSSLMVTVVPLPTVVTAIPQVNACSGNVPVPVLISNGYNLGSISLSLYFCPDMLTYTGYHGLNPSLDAGVLVVNAAGDKIKAGWYSLVPANVGTDTLFVLDFAGSPGSCAFSWDVATYGECMYSNYPGTILPASFVDGLVSIGTCDLLEGTVSYDNTAATPITGATVRLMSGGLEFRSVQTDAAGHYTFSNLPNGTYQLRVSSGKPWGGVNSVDALQTMRHFVQSISLAGIRLAAADVDASGYVNSMDALSQMRRFVSMIYSFPAGDWCFEKPVVILDGMGNKVQNIKGLCFGDVDGSYIPPTQ